MQFGIRWESDFNLNLAEFIRAPETWEPLFVFVDCNWFLSENVRRMKLQRQVAQLVLLVLIAFVTSLPAMSQSGYVLWGDVKIDDSKAATPGPSSVTIVLYDRSTKIVGRLTVGNRGRYRFSNLRGEE